MKWNTGNTIAALTFATLVVGCNTEKQQAGCPQITRQPGDQLAKLGSSVDLTVKVADGHCHYQWLANGEPLSGETGSTLRFAKIEVKDAGFYSCEISRGMDKVVTRAANVEVYTTSISAQGGIDPITVYAKPVSHVSTLGQCPGSSVGYVYYTYTNGWGWTPDTNDYTTFTAADGTTATNTKVTYMGWSGDGNCDQTSISIPNPPQSTNYQFYIYFSKKIPATNYPIVLTGFYP